MAPQLAASIRATSMIYIILGVLSVVVHHGDCLGLPDMQNFMNYGLPSNDNLRFFQKFVLSYDRRTKEPFWVMEHLTPDMFPGDVSIERDSGFREDSELHPYFRSKNRDYKGAGYDKGHLAPAGDFNLDPDSSSETFTLSNISPQAAPLNRGLWLRLEFYVRNLAKQARNLYVISGPVFMPQKEKDGKNYVRYEVIGESGVGVPTHFYKVILAEVPAARGKVDLYMETFLTPNSQNIDKDKPVEDYRIPLSELPMIEQMTGLIFFSSVNRAKVKPMN